MTLSLRWQHYYMNLAMEVGKGSKDGSSKMGAVLVRPDKTLASIGFNGFPKRIKDDAAILNDPVRRAEKYKRIVHAEANCLDYNRDHETDGYHLFVNAHPCDKCALRIAATGIAVVYYREMKDYEERWAESVADAKMLLGEAGIAIVRVDQSGSSFQNNT